MSNYDKQRFVDECYVNTRHTAKWVLSVLGVFGEYEKQWRMDFAEQSIDKLHPAFDRIVSLSFHGSKTLLSIMKKYAKWRIRVGLPCSDAVFSIDVDPIIDARDTMVASPGHLRNLLNVTFDESVAGTVDILYRSIIWLVFSGITSDEALHVRNDELDFDDMLIRRNGAKYPIYPESRYDLMAARNADSFVDSFRSFEREDGTTLLRGKRSNRISDPDRVLNKSIRPVLSRRFMDAYVRNDETLYPLNLSFDVTLSRIYDSGVFYRLYQEEQSGVYPDFAEYANKVFDADQLSDKPHIISKSNPKPAVILRIRKTAELNYKIWKRAFKL